LKKVCGPFISGGPSNLQNDRKKWFGRKLGASGGLGRSDSLKTGSVSPWLFAKPAKTASYDGGKCPKLLWDSLQKIC
jgi:hypothetical protein